MSDEAPEGWQVRQRPAMIAAVMIPLVLLLVVTVAGWFYCRDLAPARRAPVTTFPAPGIETYSHDGAGDPQRPLPPTKADPRLDAAKRATVAQGWPR
jgi:hypothetical protein